MSIKQTNKKAQRVKGMSSEKANKGKKKKKKQRG